ncbi:MAG: ATP-binding protein, partial [Bacteroidota bacterium]
KFINSDIDSIRIILFNLIENAIKYTESGFVEFGYKIILIDRDELSGTSPQSIQFYVKDTGMGIDKKDVKFIFDKFSKISPGKTKLYRGLGLGLTVVKSMVEQLNGKIWLESEINKGSAFYFTIPDIPTLRTKK